MQRTYEWITKTVAGELRGEAPIAPIEGASIDSRAITTGQLYIPIVGSKFDGHYFIEDAAINGSTLALWQRDHKLPEELVMPLIIVDDTLKALHQLAQAYREEFNIPVLAITGSNGKTTTKEIAAALLRTKYRVHANIGNLNNEYGLPLTLLSMPAETEIAVLELGMNHAGEIARLSNLARPTIALITNIGEAHIEFLGSREAIAAAKWEIVEGLGGERLLIYNEEEPLLCDLASKDSSYNYSTPSMTRGDWDFSTFSTKFPGRHNIKNASLAILAAQALGVSSEEIGRGLADVPTTYRRFVSCVAENGMQVIDDTYNASPTSMRASIDALMGVSFAGEKWALLGDMYELGERTEEFHRQVGSYAAQAGVTRLYTVGGQGEWIASGAKAVQKIDKYCTIDHIETKEEAIALFQREGHAGIMLLIKASRGLSLDDVVRPLLK